MKRSLVSLLVLFSILVFGCSDAVNNPVEITHFSVSETSLTFSESGGQQLVAVSGNTPWTAVSDHGWCSVSPAGGNGDGNITITVQKNNALVQRTAKITIETADNSEIFKIAITQAAGQPQEPAVDSFGNSIYADPALLEFQIDSESKSVQITANVSWQIVSDQSWCTVSAADGTGDTLLSVTVEANTGAERFALLTIANTEFELEYFITVKQAAPKTFIYTASAGSGGTISPSGQVQIKQGENKTFIAVPNTDMVINQWLVNGTAVAGSDTSCTVTNVQADGTIQVTFKAAPGFAPETLDRGYIFATTPGGSTSTTVDYWIWNSTRGFSPLSINYYTNKRIDTSYTYTKTGPNTATFIFTVYQSRQDNAISPIRITWWTNTGTLTFTSAAECTYVYTYIDESGRTGGSTKTYYPYIDPSVVYLPD